MVYNMKIAQISNSSDLSKREQILALLEVQQGWLSGEMMAEQLGISRAAVAKHMAALRATGHGIESASRRGYRLVVKTDDFTIEDMQARLKTRVLGKKEWLYFDSIPSTNRQAIIWAAGGAETGCIILSESQTEGRGRKGGHWFSVPRGIQCSIVLRPPFQEDRIPLLTMLATVAVTEAILQCTSLVPRIKAPNDVLLNERKICGVLVETGLRATEIEWAVVGIGCNVNAVQTDFAEDLQASASSIFIESHVPVSRMTLLARILERVEFWYDLLQTDECDSLRKRWAELGGESL
jgi:birA, biotin-[acetyl-CoA-carboxylase] ligase region